MAACTSPPRDLDMMVWTRPGWDPGQEQRDYTECFEHARNAAYRSVHWRRLAVAEAAKQTAAEPPSAGVLSRLREIAADERAAAAVITEQCMIARGYALVPIDKALP